MMDLISSAFLTVTQKCNLACKYCFVQQAPKSIDFEMAKDVADFLAENALKNFVEGRCSRFEPPSINFFGGEPMIMWDEVIVPLTEYIRGKYGDYGLSMTTNGLLLDRDRLDYIKANDIGLLLSVDGDKQTQDINRPFHDGSGSFERTDKIIDLVLEYFPNMTFRATVDHDTAKFLHENYLYAERKGYNNSFFIPNIFSEWSENELNDLEENLKKIADHIIDKKKKGEPYVKFSHFEKAKSDVEKLRKYGNKERMEFIRKCGLGASRFAAIGPDGTIYTCQEMVGSNMSEEFVIGDIYSGTSDDKRLKAIQKFEVSEIRSSRAGACDSCNMLAVCDGGCPINNYFKFRDVNVLDYTLCKWYQDCIMETERIMEVG